MSSHHFAGHIERPEGAAGGGGEGLNRAFNTGTTSVVIASVMSNSPKNETEDSGKFFSILNSILSSAKHGARHCQRSSHLEPHCVPPLTWSVDVEHHQNSTQPVRASASTPLGGRGGSSGRLTKAAEA